MKSFYSIIYIKPNSLTSEKIAVALMLVSESKVWFEFEPSKINLAEKFFQNKNSINSITNTLKGIKTLLEENNNKDTNLFVNDLFNEKEQFIKEDYLNYLHHYRNNIIHFSKPFALALSGNDIIFNNLLVKFLDKLPKSTDYKKHNIHHQFKSVLKEANIEDKVDIDLIITPKEVKGIYADTTVKVIGKNGVLTAANSIDFLINEETLISQLNQWDVLVNSLNFFSEDQKWGKGNYYLFFNEPMAKSTQEKILNTIVKTKNENFHLATFDEVDNFIQNIKINNYQPLSELW